jgi:predicted RecA/RadA family phage recombinase
LRNFIQPGDVVTVAAPATIASGGGVLVGTLFGVAVTDAASGEPVEIKTTGVFTLPKASAQAWTVGVAIYWDGSLCTTVSTDNTLIGKALAVAANPSGSGVVRLDD